MYLVKHVELILVIQNVRWIKNYIVILYDVVRISSKTIEVVKITQESGYYIGGSIKILESAFEAKILKFSDNIIYIDQAIPENLKNYKKVVLIVRCDKKFITCCNKFNNAVNFRSEPFIPEYNFLKINIMNKQFIKDFKIGFLSVFKFGSITLKRASEAKLIDYFFQVEDDISTAFNKLKNKYERN